MNAKSIITAELHKIGVRNGDVVLIHADLKRTISELVSRGVSERLNASLFFESIVEVIGTEGTLLLPAFNFTDWPKNGKFSIIDTPSEMGVLSEYVRKTKDAVRTGHPIYSFLAVGKRAPEIAKIDNHSGYGDDSPFGFLENNDGRIVVFGLPDQRCMTSYHYIEEKIQVPYRYFKQFSGTYVDRLANESQRTYSLYVRNLEQGITTFLDNAEELMWDHGRYSGCRFDEGLGIRSIRMRDLVSDTMDFVAKNGAENFLFKKISNNAVN